MNDCTRSLDHVTGGIPLRPHVPMPTMSERYARHVEGEYQIITDPHGRPVDAVRKAPTNVN